MTLDSAVPGSPPGLRASGQTSGHEGDTSAGGRVPAGVVTGEGDTPAGNPFRAPQQRPEPDDWRYWAACLEVDPELFHPAKGKPAAPAKMICADCVVAFECLEFALAHEMTFGVWGGLSERERRRLHRAIPKVKKPVLINPDPRPVTEKMTAARRANIAKARIAQAAKRAAPQMAQPRTYERTGIHLAGATSPRQPEEHERV